MTTMKIGDIWIHYFSKKIRYLACIYIYKKNEQVVRCVQRAHIDFTRSPGGSLGSCHTKLDSTTVCPNKWRQRSYMFGFSQ